MADEGSASADALLLQALDELRMPTTLHAPIVSPQVRQDRQLAKVLEMRCDTSLALRLARWRTFVAVSEATEPLEDNVFTAQQALRRAHTMLQATVQQQKPGVA